MKISIITPSFNSGKYIEESIQSVLKQGYNNFEHIIIDGGSTDGTIEILKKYPHLKWISKPDRGQSDAMNKGFAISAGNIIGYLNADDYYEQNAFKIVLNYFKMGAKFVVGKVRVINENGQYWINDPKIKFEEMLRWWESNAYCFNPVGYFYLREVQENTEYDIQNHHTMDLKLLLDSSLKYEFVKCDQILGTFRLIPGTKTKSSRNYKYYKLKYSFCDDYLINVNPKYRKKYFVDKKKFLLEQKHQLIFKNYNIIKNLVKKIYKKF